MVRRATERAARETMPKPKPKRGGFGPNTQASHSSFPSLQPTPGFQSTRLLSPILRFRLARLSVVPEQNGAASGNMYAINGKIMGNLYPWEAQLGDRVRWYVGGFGSEQDLHTGEGAWADRVGRAAL